MQFSRTARAIALVAMLGVSSAAWSANENTVSAQVGTSLKAGSEQLSAKDYPAALQTLRTGLAATGLSDFEKFSYNRLMVGAAFGAGDYAQAAASAELVLSSPFLDPAESTYLQQTLLNSALQLKDYNKAGVALTALLSKDSTNPQMMQLRTKVAYFGKEFEVARKSAKAEIDAAEKAGSAPAEETLKIYADSASNLGDEKGYTEGLKYLTRYYPTADYWSDLLYRTQEQGAFKATGDLHFYRLLFAADAWKDSGEFIDAAEAFIKAGFPLEAQAALKAGKEKGMLPTPELAKLYKEKVAQVDGLVKQDLALLKKVTIQGKDSGMGLVSNGYNLVLAGDSATGLGMIQEGLSKGVKNEALARLTLGEGAWLSGNPDLSKQQFEAIQANAEMKLVAELWLIKLAN